MSTRCRRCACAVLSSVFLRLPALVLVSAGCTLPSGHAARDAGLPEIPGGTDPVSNGHLSGLAQELADWRDEPSAAASLAFAPGESASPANRAGPAEKLAESATEQGARHRVSVDAAQVPLASLLFLLAREASLELQPHAAFDAPVTYRAEDRPLSEVLDQLAAQRAFAWRIESGRLVVRSPSPYADSYPVDYLNVERTTRGRVGLATRVGTLSGDGRSDSAAIANSSETLIENVSEHRFWAALAIDLDALLANDTAAGARVSLNRDVGLVSVHATPRTHAAVRHHLEEVQRLARRQVLIEASVVEVSLSNRYEAGIDWQVLANGINGLSAVQAFGALPRVDADSVARLAAPAALVSLVQSGAAGSVGATLSLLERFGEVRILSRPRIIALNNQASVLKVVDNRVYFSVSVQRRFDDEREQITTESEIHTVPVGLVMNVTPQIGAGGQVMLNVRPTLSRILGFVDDPNPELALADVRNGVPEIQVRELESMLNVNSGDVAIIGGLMQDATRDDDTGLPGLSRLPLLGRLFSRAARSRERSELLIVLRATVLPPGPDAGSSKARS